MMKSILAALAACAILHPSPALSQDESQVVTRVTELSDLVARGFERVQDREKISRIAVTSFANVGTQAEEKRMGQVVAELMSTQFAQKPQFVVVERERIDKVLEEMKLSLVGLTAQGAEKLGKMLDAKAIITGSVTEIGEYFSINARMVEVSSGRVVLAAGVRLHQAGMIALSEKYLVRKTRSDAMFRSMAMPGWGQVYNEQPVKGYIISTVVVGLIGTTIYEYISARQAYDKYKQGTPDTVKYYDTAQQNYRLGDTLLYALIGVWALNVIDAYAYGPDREEIKITQPEQRAALTAPVRHARVSLVPAPGYMGIRYDF